MAFSDYSTNPNSNTTVGGISIAEGCPAGNLNNALRLFAADGRSLSDVVAGLSGAANVPTTRTISAAGLATGGGDLSANRTITVTAASSADALAATDNTKALTALSLGGLAKSLTTIGYYTFPGGLILQWYPYRSIITSELAIPVLWPLTFPNACFSALSSPYLDAASGSRNMWVQTVAPNASGCTVQVQRDTDSGAANRIDGFDVWAVGF